MNDSERIAAKERVAATDRSRADSAYPGRPTSVWSYRPGLEPSAFPRTNWGHRGYDEACVDAFVEQALKDRDAAELQISDLRTEVDRLHRYIRRQWAAVAAAESESADPQRGRSGEGLVTPAAQAKAVLSQAQEIADRRLAEADARLTDAERLAADRLASADREIQIKLMDADGQASRLIGAGQEEAAHRLTRVDMIAEQVLIEAGQDAANRRAQAEDDATRLLLLARTRYQDLMVRAHQRADRAAEVALTEIEHPTTTFDGGRVRAELEMKAAYLRTFAKVSRASLRAALDVTAREFDRLLGASAGSAALPMESDPAPVDSTSGQVRGDSTSDRVRVDSTSDQVPVDPALRLEPVASARRAARTAPRPRMIVLPDTAAAELAAVIQLQQ
jgi:cell division septum initiation protein DivIVA